ncbi:MAG: hypothetical protein WC211_03685 [Dehalococcoidia bacterium]
MIEFSEYLTFGSSAPLITLLIGLLRQVFPGIDGKHVPRAVVVATLAWGVVLVASGLFTGSPAEFVIAAATTSALAIAINRGDKATKTTPDPYLIDSVRLNE